MRIVSPEPPRWARAERGQPPARALFSAAAGSGAEPPSTERSLASWNAVTAASVCGPKVPSAGPGSYPAADRASWSARITAGSPASPSWSFVPSRRVKLEAPSCRWGRRRRRRRRWRRRLRRRSGLRGSGLRGRGRRGGGLGDGCHRRLIPVTQQEHRGDDAKSDEHDDDEPGDEAAPLDDRAVRLGGAKAVGPARADRPRGFPPGCARARRGREVGVERRPTECSVAFSLQSSSETSPSQSSSGLLVRPRPRPRPTGSPGRRGGRVSGTSSMLCVSPASTLL